MESVVFQDHDIYYFLYCKKIPPISGDLYGKYVTKFIEKNSNLKHHKISKEFTTQFHHF